MVLFTKTGIERLSPQELKKEIEKLLLI